ncbi:hypothetical protein B7463_g12479, partial [Scytalidium lignicola]
MILARAWATFFLGSGVAFFAAIGWVGTSIANTTCSSAMWLALFGVGTAIAGTSACIAAGAIAVLATSVASGLATYGYSVGWTFEGEGAALGKRDGYKQIVDTTFGLAHNYDADTHKALNLTLNMTLGRLVTLNDNGVIRVAIGATSGLGQIMDGFDAFKSSKSTAAAPSKRQSSETVDWISFNTYGENMEEGGEFLEAVDEDANASASSADYSVDGWAEGFDYYSTKFCLGASPANNGLGQNSIVVGEVYTNAYGGIDTFCDSG